jgi:Methyltransferase domain
MFLGWGVATPPSSLCIRRQRTKLKRPTALSSPEPTPLDAPLAAYLLGEPFVAGRVVLDVGPRPARAAERLGRAGARQIVNADGPGPRLEVGDGSMDVVFCVARLCAVGTDVERHRWFAELRRVLAPGGFCVVRVPVADLGATGQRPLELLESLLRAHFAAFDVVSESPLAGLSFTVPSTDDVAVNEELATISPTPTHFVALCAEGGEKPWHLPESLLVPLRPAGAVMVTAGGEQLAALREEIEEITARHHAACVERDALRDALMTLQDREDAREEALSSLRREVERLLRQISDDATSLELGALERERLDRRASSAERALESLGAQLQQRNAELVALERELARVRGTAAVSVASAPRDP